MEAGLTDHVWTIEDLVTLALTDPHGEPPHALPLGPREGSGPVRQTARGLASPRTGRQGRVNGKGAPTGHPLDPPWRPMEQLSLFDGPEE